MFGSFLKGIKGFANKLGLGKEVGQLGGLFNKAKGYVSQGMDFLRSKPVKSIVNSLSEHMPSVGSFYKDANKYGSIVSNMMRGGLDRKADRFMKQPPSIERVRQSSDGMEPRKRMKEPEFVSAASLFD